MAPSASVLADDRLVQPLLHCISFSVSPSIRRVTGMPVHLATDIGDVVLGDFFLQRIFLSPVHLVEPLSCIREPLAFESAASVPYVRRLLESRQSRSATYRSPSAPRLSFTSLPGRSLPSRCLFQWASRSSLSSLQVGELPSPGFSRLLLAGSPLFSQGLPLDLQLLIMRRSTLVQTDRQGALYFPYAGATGRLRRPVDRLIRQEAIGE